MKHVKKTRENILIANDMLSRHACPPPLLCSFRLLDLEPLPRNWKADNKRKVMSRVDRLISWLKEIR